MNTELCLNFKDIKVTNNILHDNVMELYEAYRAHEHNWKVGFVWDSEFGYRE